MSKIVSCILCLLFALISCSALYYICLVLVLPVFVFLILAAAILIISGNIYLSLEPERSARIPWPFILICLAFIVGMIWASNTDYQEYGDWDAYSMWNYHARFMADSVNWKRLYLVSTMNHPDYPLGLSGMVAPVWRITGINAPLVPHALAILMMIAVPFCLAATLQPRNQFIALAVILYFCTSASYRSKGISEFADTLLALFFLACFIAVDLYKNTGNKSWLVLCGGCAAGLIWTKNEGLILSGVFILFHLRLLSGKKVIPLFLGGALLPAAALLIHKFAFAPANDLVASGKSVDRIQLITDPERITTILRFFADMMWNKFRPIVYAAGFYLLWVVIKKRRPNSIVTAVMVCLIGYMGVYMITPYSLDWHLYSSFDRLTHQLVPALLYGICLQLTVNRSAMTTTDSPLR